MSSIIKANELRKGKIIELENEIWEVLDWEFHRKGRGGSTIKMVLKGLDTKSQKILDCSVDEKFNAVDIREEIIQYMYNDGDGIYSMDSEYYPYSKLDKEIEDLIESEMHLKVIYINDEIKRIGLPMKTKVKVIETDPSLKGQTAKASYKPAKLANGWIVQVPPFIETDDIIIINTVDMIYESKGDE
jgi:elongation factor P